MLAHRLRLAAIALASLALSGCYVLQAASGQAEVIRRSEPIPKVLADPSIAAKTKERLQLVEAARAFAISELALRDGKSYRKYPVRPRAADDVGDDDVAAVVAGAQPADLFEDGQAEVGR